VITSKEFTGNHVKVAMRVANQAIEPQFMDTSLGAITFAVNVPGTLGVGVEKKAKSSCPQITQITQIFAMGDTLVLFPKA